MAIRRKTVLCPQCKKRLSPQGLNGHLRFVHGVGSVEASQAVARAPRGAEAEPAVAKLAARVEALEEQFAGFLENLEYEVEERWSPSGMRRRLVALVRELAEVKRQRSNKEWDVFWSGSDENKQVVTSLDQVESDILSEIAVLRTKLGESGA